MMIKNKKLILMLIFSIFTNSVLAGSMKTGNPERKRSNSEAFSERVYNKFVKLQEMIADSKYVEARTGLKLLAEGRLNSFETANVNQYIGWIDSAEGKYVAAAKQFQKALDSDSLANQAHFSMMLQMAQMYIAGGKHQKGINALNKYYKVTDEISDGTFALEANAYAQINKYREAIPIMIKAIGLSETPKENWNYVLYSMHMQLSQFQQASKVLETLISINPNKKVYWKRLSSVYFNLKKDDKALAVLIVADKNNLLNEEKDILQLFKMYAYLGVPYKAGQVLQKGLADGVVSPNFKRWDDLGKIWYSAAELEKSLKAYGEASKLATDGKIDFQMAYIYFDRENWKKSRESTMAAIEKGGLKERKVGQAWLLLGMVESELGNNKSAIKALEKATKYEKTRKNALQWIGHLNDQAKRKRERAQREKMLDEETVNT